MSKSEDLAKRALAPATAILLLFQSLIVVTGGAVRLTGSGLGCPTWPECTPGSYFPVEGQIEGALHAWIEFGNRLLTFVLALAAIITLIVVIKSGRKDIRLLAIGQILGILGQGVLGGITVLTQLNPLTVASHFLLSAVLIAAAVSLYSRRGFPAEKKDSARKTVVFARLHIAITALVVILGTLVTGAGPHAGDIDSPRLKIGIEKITFLHGLAVAILLIVTVAFFNSSMTSELTKKRLAIFSLLTLAQGVIGFIQYIQGVPELLVAAHLVGSILVWIAAWSVWLSVQQEKIGVTK